MLIEQYLDSIGKSLIWNQLMEKRFLFQLSLRCAHKL